MNKYFVFDGTDYNFETFATEKERDKRVKEIIERFRDDEEWLEECDMNGIVSGFITITHRVQQVDYEARPDENDLDEDGCDEDGEIWEGWCEYKCNYENLPVKEEDHE